MNVIQPNISEDYSHTKQSKNIRFWNVLDLRTKIIGIFLIIMIIANIIIHIHSNCSEYESGNQDIKVLIKANNIHKNPNLYNNFYLNNKIKSLVLYYLEFLLLFKKKPSKSESNGLFLLLTNAQLILIVPQLFVSILIAIFINDLHNEYSHSDSDERSMGRFTGIIIQYILLNYDNFNYNQAVTTILIIIVFILIINYIINENIKQIIKNTIKNINIFLENNQKKDEIIEQCTQNFKYSPISKINFQKFFFIQKNIQEEIMNQSKNIYYFTIALSGLYVLLILELNLNFNFASETVQELAKVLKFFKSITQVKVTIIMVKLLTSIITIILIITMLYFIINFRGQIYNIVYNALLIKHNREKSNLLKNIQNQIELQKRSNNSIKLLNNPLVHEIIIKKDLKVFFNFNELIFKTKEKIALQPGFYLFKAASGSGKSVLLSIFNNIIMYLHGINFIIKSEHGFKSYNHMLFAKKKLIKNIEQFDYIDDLKTVLENSQLNLDIKLDNLLYNLFLSEQSKILNEKLSFMEADQEIVTITKILNNIKEVINKAINNEPYPQIILLDEICAKIPQEKSQIIMNNIIDTIFIIEKALGLKLFVFIIDHTSATENSFNRSGQYCRTKKAIFKELFTKSKEFNNMFPGNNMDIDACKTFITINQLKLNISDQISEAKKQIISAYIEKISHQIKVKQNIFIQDKIMTLRSDKKK